MRIGIPDSIVFGRYGTWWTTFLETIDVEAIRPKASFADSMRIGQNAMPEEAPTMQLLLGRILELATEVEGLLIPDVNPGAEPGTRGAAVEPWLVDLATMLSQRFSLPTLYKVPAKLEPSQTTAYAVRIGQMLTGNAQLVRRALDRLQTGLKPISIPEPIWQLSGHTTIGLVADPVLLEQAFLIEPVLAALKAVQLHAIPISVIARDRATEEGARINPHFLEINRELVGAAKLLAAKAAIRGLVYVAQPFADSQRKFLLQRSSHNIKKPSVMLEWGNLDMEQLQTFAASIRI